MSVSYVRTLFTQGCVLSQWICNHSGTAIAIRKAKANLTVLPRVLTKIFAKAIANFLKPSYRPQRSWGKVMFLHVSVILFMGGVVSQHALQVSMGDGIPTCLAGGIPACLAGLRGVSRPTPRWEVEGLLVRGVSRPTPGGSPGPHQGGLQAHTWQVVSQHALRQTPPGAVHAGRYGQQAGSTHPTGMHSCSH